MIRYDHATYRQGFVTLCTLSAGSIYIHNVENFLIYEVRNVYFVNKMRFKREETSKKRGDDKKTTYVIKTRFFFFFFSLN